jgi:hypothetical protein
MNNFFRRALHAPDPRRLRALTRNCDHGSSRYIQRTPLHDPAGDSDGSDRNAAARIPTLAKTLKPTGHDVPVA